jgi:A/G-specific adenine glycosylase
MAKSTPEDLLARRRAFHRALHAWYARAARPLPWRESPSLYKTVVSEFMLQQTQVKTVLPYFGRWLAELPTFAALAAAPESQVLKLWEGLGYYSRARNLHKLAHAIVAAGTPPRDPLAWRELPGVGPYTAAAITSIAFDAPAACVDGNVVRILSRLTADGTEYPDSATAAKAFAPLAQALLPDVGAGDHNQAMMELGATVCIRQNPLCSACPVQKFCAATASGAPEAYPRLAATKIERRAVARVWCERDRALLHHRAPATAKRFANIHELPLAETIGFEPSGTGSTPLAQKRRAITRFQIVETIHAAPAPKPKLADDLVWVPLAELDRVTLSGPHRRWIQEILAKRRD